ncbi:hypothetical protein [Candidatus Laterigemmans baculatus]|uniref:hypothetical protein n=1 Tax=Candidatus Laterigemmans baculatus TaxID=2770505 RepID=UPI0013DAD283|nr:hypothetical protein [Candidatus Laterigemmans baculatus]
MQPANSSSTSSAADSPSPRPLAGDGWRVVPNGSDASSLVCAPWYAVVSSRLGRVVEKRRRWFALLERSVQRAIADRAALLVVAGTAPEPWVVRATELFRVPLVRVEVADPRARDRVLVELADRLFVLRARRGGQIERLVTERIAAEKRFEQAAPAVYVAIHDDPDDCGASLVDRGAVGWWIAEPAPAQAAASWPKTGTEELLTLRSAAAQHDAWLVHCTRGHCGRWPWQSETQWRDEVLLGGEGAQPLSPLEVLERILREGRLRGSAAVTSTGPVVCFSAVPLAELLARRTYRPHLGRWDYEPFGIAIRRSRLEALGGRPVVYGSTLADAGLAEDERWRFQATGRTFDWRREQEWRVAGSLDLDQLHESDAFVFVDDAAAARRVAPQSRWPLVLV